MSAGPVVVKLGGAQARGPFLRGWLQAVAAAPGRIALVPGGGPFADAVRATQGEIGFSDEAAHEMALMAMAQFGRALVSLAPGLELVEAEDALFVALARGVTPVWSPLRMALAAGLPASWDMTSDSLAAWLAGRLGAARLILVKHGEAAPAKTLAARGVVDPLFPFYLAQAGVEAHLAPPERAEGLAETLGADYPRI